MLLTAIGIYAVIAATVGDRTREIAIRLALGGATRRVVWTVVRQVLLVTLVGIAAGLLASLAATRFVEPLLFGIARTDAATYAAIAAVMMTVALLSSYLPVRRIAYVDPAITLRAE